MNSARLGGRNIAFGDLKECLVGGFFLFGGGFSVSAKWFMSGTLEFFVWRNLSVTISKVVVSFDQPSKARVFVPTDLMLWKIFTLPFFPDAMVAIARFPQGWISSVMSGRIDRAVVMVGMISSIFWVSIGRLGIEMDWSQFEGGSGSFCLVAPSRMFLKVDLYVVSRMTLSAFFSALKLMQFIIMPVYE